MGKHYLPQRYLQQFAIPGNPEEIWMFDMESGDSKPLSIKIVAQSKDFYSDEDESRLNLEIEAPAGRPLDLLRNGQQICLQDRRLVAKYLESMLKRVPSFRLLMLQVMREDGAQAYDEVRANPEQWASTNGLDISRDQLLQLVDEWERGFGRDDISIKDDLVRGQWTTPKIVQTLMDMTWRISTTDLSKGFLTGDNPLFFYPKSEITFPLSSCTALHGCWHGRKGGLLFGDAEPALVKEFNRRVIHNANRFLFFHQNVGLGLEGCPEATHQIESN